MLQPSDEEILGYDSADEDEDEDEEQYEEDDYDEDDDDMGETRHDVGSDEEEGIAAWGSSKKDLYNADQIETEVDALEEEQEAKRLQQKQLQAMDEADFGFDESEWMDSGKGLEDEAEDAGVVTEVLPQVEITDDMGSDEKLKILKSRYPEFEPLAKDFTDLQRTHQVLQKAAANASTASSEMDDELQPTPVAVMKLRALSAYLGTISLYFMLLASSSDGTKDHVPMSPAELRQHPVMGSLVKFRKLWEKVKDLEITEAVEEAPSKIVKTVANFEPAKSDKVAKKTKEVKQQPKKKLSKAERAALDAQAEADRKSVV